jgi:tetratricopeptide (TPR) repeat protein
LLWNKSIQSKIDGDEAAADQYLGEAAKELKQGLDGIAGALADGDAMRAALVLAKVYLRQGKIQAAYDAIENKKYGPVVLIEKQGAPDPSFPADLYSVQLQVLVQRMTTEGEDTSALLNRATDVMEKLRDSIQGPDSQRDLTRIFILMARDIREQLKGATPARKSKLVEAFRVFLDRISDTTDDVATLQWVGQTLMDLAEASMTGGETITPLSTSLLTTADSTLKSLSQQDGGNTLVVRYQRGKALRLLGQYRDSLSILEGLLKEKSSMLDAQVEAALAYEQWASKAPPAVQSRVYQAALAGARPGENKKNIIWGWGKISQETSRNPKFQDRFFDARYHVALCRFLAGKSEGNQANKKLLIEKSLTDITRVAALYPALGGVEQRKKFDSLLRLIQKELGQSQVGLPKQK